MEETTHQENCIWMNSDCEYKDTHQYCPHQEHLCKCSAIQKELDSDKLNSEINKVCTPCGISANVLTCLYRYGAPPKKLCFEVSTFGSGKCDWCGKRRPVTQTRDFFYPNFSFLREAQKINQERLTNPL